MACSSESIVSEIGNPRDRRSGEAATRGQGLNNSPQGASATENNNDVISPSCSTKAAPPPKSPASNAPNTRGKEDTSSTQKESASDLVGEGSSYYEQDWEDVENHPEGGRKGHPPYLTPFSRVPDVIYDTVVKAEQNTAPTSPLPSEKKWPLTTPPLFSRPALNDPSKNNASSIDGKGVDFGLGTYDDIAVHMVSSQSPNKPETTPKLPAIQHKKHKMVRAPLHHKPDKNLVKSEDHRIKHLSGGTYSPNPSATNRKRSETGHLKSSEDIYDDIVVHRMQNQSLGKPSLPPKPTGIHLQSNKHETKTLALASRSGNSNIGPIGTNSESTYEDVVIHQLQNESVGDKSPKPHLCEEASKHDMTTLALASKDSENIGSISGSEAMYDDITIDRVQQPHLHEETSEPDMKTLNRSDVTIGSNPGSDTYDEIAVHRVQPKPQLRIEETSEHEMKIASKNDGTTAMYDDIIIHGTQSGFVGKSKLLRKPQLDEESKNELKTALTGKTDENTASANMYDAIVVHGIQNGPLGESKLPPQPQLHEETSKHEMKTPALASKSDENLGSKNISENMCDDIAVHEIQRGPVEKPKLLPKPTNIPLQKEVNKSEVMTLAPAKRKAAPKVASEDIYDDIVVFRSQAKAKPKLLPKPTNIKISKIKKNPSPISKDAKSLVPQKDAFNVSNSSDTTEVENIYDDTVIKAMRKNTFTSFEDIYDNIIIKRLHHHPNKPHVPVKPTSILSHPKVAEFLRKKKWQQLQEIEEIYDLDPPEPADTIGSSDDDYVEEIYLDSTIMEEEQDASREPQNGTSGAQLVSGADSASTKIASEKVKNVTGQSSKPTDETTTESVLLNSNAGPASQPTAGAGEVEDDEVYDELIIYEELGSSSNDGYQDIEQARTEALGLPRDIRMRSSRIVRGKERKKLKQTLKRRSLSFNEGNGNPLPKDSGNESPTPEQESAAPVHDGSSSEDETHDGYMSHGKARQVLDMLLEANNVKKVAHKEKYPMQQSLSVLCDPVKHADITADHVILPPEVEEYQRAGVLQTKSPSDIAAEIKFLTESAPKEPPPLPGQRPRKGNVTRSDALILKQRRVKKSLTMPNPII